MNTRMKTPTTTRSHVSLFGFIGLLAGSRILASSWANADWDLFFLNVSVLIAFGASIAVIAGFFWERKFQVWLETSQQIEQERRKPNRKPNQLGSSGIVGFGWMPPDD